MNLETAIQKSELLLKQHLAKHFSKYQVCGSIRRKREEVRDIDIVAIPKPESEYGFGEKSLADEIALLDKDGQRCSEDMGKQAAARYLNGDKIKRFKFEGEMIDLYLANEKTFETLVLIRTGSKDHNVRLTTQAKFKGMKLKADGTGLVNRDHEDVIIDKTENGILEILLGFVPEPEKRGLD